MKHLKAPMMISVGALDGDSNMEISDDRTARFKPSSVSSCLQTHPPPYQEAHDFLSSLFLEPAGEGVWPGDGTADEEGAGVCPVTRPVDTAGGVVVVIYWHSNLVASSDWLRMLAHVHTLTYMLRRWNFGSSKLRMCAFSFREAQALCAFGF
jgi:hypothetical protein